MNIRLTSLLFLLGIIFIPYTLICNTYSTSDNGDPCDITIEMPFIKHLCEAGDFDLCANVFGPTNQIDVEWYEDGDFLTDKLCDDVYIEEETEFTLIASYTEDVNLIENGDFEDGDNDFNTDYDLVPGPCSPSFELCDGYYAIWDETSQGHPGFASCGDHTSGSGLMMAVNGIAGKPELWCQDVCIDPSASYILSGYGTSIHPDSPAELQFSVDGNLVGNSVDLGTNLCEWINFTGEFDADGETSVEICVYNENGEQFGNDFAIDDIEMFQVCSAEETITVYVSDLEVNLPPSLELNCNQSELEIEANITSSGDINRISWSTTSGSIIGSSFDEEITISGAGSYTITVTDEYGCTSTAQTEVIANSSLPEADILGNTLLNCDSTATTLSAITNVVNPNYLWVDTSGNILSTTASLTVSDSTEVILQLTDLDSNCTNSDTVSISLDNLAPSINLLKSNDLTCTINQANLSTAIPQDSVVWTSNNNTVINSTNDSITVTVAGEYYAETFSNNGCRRIDTIVVSGIPTNFAYLIDADASINCNEPISEVKINFDSAIYTFSWTGTAAILGIDNNVQISDSGTYTFELIDANGCTKSDSIAIAADFFTPEVFVNADIITCASPETTITINWLEQVPWIEDVYWTLPDGSIEEGGISITTNQPGWTSYEAIVSRNGCAIVDSIFIEASTDFPSVSIIGDTITCLQNIATLESEGSSNITTYLWTLPDNSEDNSTSISTDIPGTYRLEVENDSGCKSFAEFTLEENIDRPEIKLASADTITCDKTTIELSPDFSTAISDLNWEGPSISSDMANISISMPGTYYLDITGTNGCSNRDSIVVTIDTIPTMGLFEAPSRLSCSLTSFEPIIIEDNSEQIDYSWILPNGEMVEFGELTISEAGSYTLITVGENGCPSSQPYVVEADNDRPEFQTQSSIITCDNPNSEIITESSNTNLEYVYQDAITNEVLGTGTSFTLSEDTELIVIATDQNGCSATQMIAIEYDTIRPDILRRVKDLTCENPTLTADVVSSDPSASFELYSDTGDLLGDETYPIEDAGAYSIRSVASNGCYTELMFTVEMDTSVTDFELESDFLTCAILEVPFNLITIEEYRSATRLHVSSGDMEEIQFGESFTDVNAPGIYDVVVTNTNGCTATKSIEVISDDNTVSFEVSAEDLSCTRTTTEIIITASESYTEIYAVHIPTLELFPDDNGIFVNLPGLYDVFFTSTSGCNSKEEIEILEFTELPEVTALEATDLDCSNEAQINSIVIEGGTEPYLVTIDGKLVDHLQNAIPVIGAGEHIVNVEDINGCKSDYFFSLDETEILSGNILSEILITDTSSRSFNLELNKPLAEIEEILWSPQINLSCYDCLTPDFTGDSSTEYNIYVRDIFGCETQLTVRAVIEVDTRIYIPNVINLNATSPDNIFVINSSETGVEEISELSIYDRWGNLVFRNQNFAPNDSSQGWNGYYNEKQVATGVFIYTAQVKYQNGLTESFSGSLTILN